MAIISGPATLIAGLILLAGGALGVMRPFAERTARELNPTALPNIPQITEALQMYWRGQITKAALQDLIAESGINPAYTDSYIEISRKAFEAFDLVTLYRRDHIDNKEFYARMEKANIPAIEADLYTKAYEYFPSASDLVRFAVREVYSPEIRERFGMDEDLPQKFIDEAAKAGMNSEQARNFWAAHWELPGPVQGYEFLHRFDPAMPDKYWKGYEAAGLSKETLATDIGTLRTLLRTLDVMPYWRDRLIGTSFTPYTRVDIRRMYQHGVLDEQDVYWAYRDIGYNDEKAQNMVNFTVKEYQQETTDLTKAQILSLYRQQIIDENQTRDFLSGIGVEKDTVDLLMFQEDLKKQQEAIDMKVKDLRLIYSKGGLTLTELREKLNALDIPTYTVDHIITQEEYSEGEKLKVAPRATIGKWLKAGIITTDEWTQRMVNMGYQYNDIELFLKELVG